MKNAPRYVNTQQPSFTNDLLLRHILFRLSGLLTLCFSINLFVFNQAIKCIFSAYSQYSQ